MSLSLRRSTQRFVDVMLHLLSFVEPLPRLSQKALPVVLAHQAILTKASTAWRAICEFAPALAPCIVPSNADRLRGKMSLWPRMLCSYVTPSRERLLIA